MPSQVTKPSDTSWTETELQRFISWVEKGQVGMISVSLTELDTTAVPDVAAGSVFECAGALYEVDSDETPTGWSGISNDTQVYIKFDVSAGEFVFTDTEPSFDEDLGGWYVGNDRYLARVYKDASGDADGKEVYAMESGTTPYKPSSRIPFSEIEIIDSGSGNWYVPAGVYAVKAIVTGGGGSGAYNTQSSGSAGIGGDTTFSTLTANGGQGGQANGGGLGGDASGGDVNITGGDGATGNDTYDGGGNGGASYWGGGGRSGAEVIVDYEDGKAYGSGGGGETSETGTGGAGGTAIAILSVSPGQSISYSVGAGGVHQAGSGVCGDGADGVIYLEY